MVALLSKRPGQRRLEVMRHGDSRPIERLVLQKPRTCQDDDMTARWRRVVRVVGRCRELEVTVKQADCPLLGSRRCDGSSEQDAWQLRPALRMDISRAMTTSQQADIIKRSKTPQIMDSCVAVYFTPR